MKSTQTSISSSDFEQIASVILENGNMMRFCAHGNSMHPFIKDGDILTITQTEISKLRKGDVAFYRKAKNDSVTPFLYQSC